MTALASLGERRPERRAPILVGPCMREGERFVHYVKDRETGRFYRFGPRECFVLGLMDGHRTLSEIASLYEREFGKRLHEAAWIQLLGLLRNRGLLVESDRSHAQPVAPTKRVQWTWKSLELRVHLLDPDRLLGWLEPRLGFMLRPWFVGVVITLMVMVDAWVLFHLAALRESLVGMARSTWTIALLISWVALAAHELAHGLACKHFGGAVRDIGILFRFLMFFPYCKLDDMVLFERRRERVLTAFAGPLSSFCFLIPFPVIWSLAAPGSPLRAISACMLTFFNLASIANLIPFLRLDGYLMLAYAVRMPKLHGDAVTALFAALRRALGRPSPPITRTVAQRWGLAMYGAVSLVVTTAMLIWFAMYWYGVFGGK